MKNAFLLLATLGLLGSCSKITPEDNVRKHRREYDISFQFIVSSSDEVSISVEVQNKSGGKNLQDLTVIIEGSDENDKVFWTKTQTLDVTGLGNQASKEISIKETVPGSSTKLQGMNIFIAPDEPGSGFENYREFMRLGS